MNVILDQIMYKLLTSTEPRNYNRKLFICPPGNQQENTTNISTFPNFLKEICTLEHQTKHLYLKN